MENVIYEVVKEYRFPVDGLNYDIKGRILKRIAGDDGLNVDFSWEISHYYKPENRIGVYIPSQKSAETAERAEQLLLMYLKSFTNTKIQINTNYKN